MRLGRNPVNNWVSVIPNTILREGRWGAAECKSESKTHRSIYAKLEKDRSTFLRRLKSTYIQPLTTGLKSV